MNDRIAARRLDNQRLTRPGPGNPADVVSWFGAVQAQEYAAAKWSLGLRMPDGATDARVERAFNDGQILRTHVMRPTWHFVTASDIRWMLELTASRVKRALAYANRYYELDTALCNRATTVFARALGAGENQTRAELGAHLARAGLAVKGVRLALLTVHAELEGVICSGPQRGKLSTYALLANRAPRGRRLSREEALAELAGRYFRSHSPATIRDFVWWSGLTTADARRAVEMIGGRQKVIDGYTYWTLDTLPATRKRPGFVHLLPTYDEYLVAYRDLDAVPRKAGSPGTLHQAVVIAGQVAGTWKVVRKPDRFHVGVTTHRAWTGRERRATAEAIARYGSFLETEALLVVA